MQHPSRRHLEAVVRDTDGQNIARCLIQRGHYTIGQDWKNEIIVDHPTVSLHHARLIMEGEDSLFIEDLQSANGTRVDGRKAEGPIPISLESVIELGGTTLEFQRGGLPAAVFEALPDGFLRKNRYNIGDIVVEGSTSIIYEAYDTSLCRNLAIKVMRPESQSAVENVLRFVREAQLGSQLQHPGILPVYELGLDPQSQLFYTTRFVEGESLSSILDSLTSTPIGTAPSQTLGTLLNIFHKICDAVAFAHSKGVVHCRLRPDCITVGAYGEVLVTQWTLAKIDAFDPKGNPVSSPLRVAPSHSLPAINAYTAPEQAAESFDEVNARSDIFSLGAILYRMLTLRAPIAPANEGELLEMVLASKIPPISSKDNVPHCPSGHVSEALAAVALKALSYKAEDRYLTVTRLQRDLLAAVETAETNLWKQFSGLLGKH